MKVTSSDIRKFHKLYFQAVGISLSDDEARSKLNKLLRQVEILINEDCKKLKDEYVQPEIKTSIPKTSIR